MGSNGLQLQLVKQLSSEKKVPIKSNNVRAKLFEKNKQRQRQLSQNNKQWYISSQPPAIIQQHITAVNNDIQLGIIVSPCSSARERETEPAISRGDNGQSHIQSHREMHHRDNSIPLTNSTTGFNSHLEPQLS